MTNDTDGMVTAVIDFGTRAIEQHLYGSEDAELLDNLTEDELIQVSELACSSFESDDRIWTVFRECVSVAIRQVNANNKNWHDVNRVCQAIWDAFPDVDILDNDDVNGAMCALADAIANVREIQ